MVPGRAQVSFRRWMTELFDQEMWCLGQDVQRPEGNVLCGIGMCQYRVSPPTRAATMYTARLPAGGDLFLWGFGAFLGDPELGGVFVRRGDFSPRLLDRSEAYGVHNVPSLGPMRVPTSSRDLLRARSLLPQLVGWFAHYEHWVSESIGRRYRQACVDARPTASWVPASDLARQWEWAAKQCRRMHPGSEEYRFGWSALIGRFRHSTHQSPIADHVHRPLTRVIS